MPSITAILCSALMLQLNPSEEHEFWRKFHEVEKRTTVIEDRYDETKYFATVFIAALGAFGFLFVRDYRRAMADYKEVVVSMARTTVEDEVEKKTKQIEKEITDKKNEINEAYNQLLTYIDDIKKQKDGLQTSLEDIRNTLKKKGGESDEKKMD